MSISIFALDVQPVAIQGLATLIRESPGFSWVGSAATASSALDCLRAQPADIVLVDNTLGIRTVLQLVADLKIAVPTASPVLWVHELSESDSMRAIQMGVRAVFRKTRPLDELIDCLKTVASGSVWLSGSDRAEASNVRASVKLTPREREIAVCVCRGLRNREIGERLSITAGTVKVHLMHIFEKTGVKDRFELAVHGRQILGPPAENGPVAATFTEIWPDSKVAS
jgi:two-component system, NarL family, nitrate/nitrite response regulator NarL